MGVAEAEAKKRSVLKPITTTAKSPSWELTKKTEGEDDDSPPSTPKGMRIPKTLRCPPAPRKRKPSSAGSRYNTAATMKFFIPPDLESVFLKRNVQVEEAK